MVLQILKIRRIDTPGFVGPLCVLVQIIGASPEHDNKLAYLHQNMNTDKVTPDNNSTSELNKSKTIGGFLLKTNKQLTKPIEKK